MKIALPQTIDPRVSSSCEDCIEYEYYSNWHIDRTRGFAAPVKRCGNHVRPAKPGHRHREPIAD
jgi:hypothetical protein